MRTSLISTIFFAILGLILIGNSFSGMVISESCCFGPICDLENLCDSAKPLMESPSDISSDFYSAYFGILSLVAAFTSLGFYRKWHI